MKKLLSLIAVLIVAVTGMLGQSPAPGILNYQGVARNSVGNVLVNKTITLRLTIRDGSAAGPVVYQESRGVTTNPFGLFNVQLGSAGASAVTGTIAGVPWGVGLKYIQVEIDPNGGSSFINIGTAQLASVPYSLYSSQANDLVLPFDKTQADAGTLFRITNSGTGSGSTALEGRTNSTAGNANAVIGTVTSTAPGGFSSGVRGINNGTGGLGIGVYGSQAGTGYGVYGTTPGGWAVRGEANTGTGAFGQSISGTGVFGQSTSGTGGRFLSTSGLALHTSGGGVRLQNINEGVNRILATIPGNGDATWQDPSAVGIVTGSGTLNYVPKWTPNGTNLGNSQIFDNGTSVGINTNTPNAAYRLEIEGIQRINNTTLQEGGELRFEEGTLFGAPNHWIIDNFQSFAGGNKFRVWNDVGGMNIQMMPGGRTAIGNMVFSDQPQSTLDVEGNLAVGTAYSGTTAAPANGAIIEGNVGIGTNSPLGKFHVSSGSSFLAANIQGSSNVGTWLSLGNTDPGGRWFNLVNTATANGEGPGKLIFFQGGAANLVTGSIMTMVHSNMNVGINSNNPTAKLQVDQNNATDVGVLVNQGNAANAANAVNVFKTNTSAGGFGNGAIYAQRGTAGGSYWTLAGVTGITSLAATAGGIGIQGTSDSGPGLVGLSTNNIGVRGFNLNSGSAARFENALNAANTAPVVFVNNISTQPGVFGVQSVIANTSPGSFSTALRGENNGTGGLGIGVWGSQNGSGWGVLGTTPSGLGVYGSTSSGIGVMGDADGGWGMRAISNTNTAIFSTSNSGFGGDFRSQTNIAGIFQSWGAGNTVRGAIQTFNPSTNAGARALYAQGSGFSGWVYNPGQVSEFQGNTTSGIVSISTNATSIVSASETGNAVYGQILTTNGNGNAAVLGASSNNNSHGLYGVTPAGGIGRALATSGPVQLTGINEATNRILASIDNFGNARWEDPSAIGVVSGSGTLNYVPKWTPNGTTLGNSQIFDNGNLVGIGTAAPAFKVHVASNSTELLLQDLDDATSISLIARGASYTGGVGTRGNDDLPLFTDNTDRVTIKAGTGDVGIGNVAPTNKLEVIQTGLTRAGFFQINNAANNSTALEVSTNGVARAIFAQSNAPGFCNCGVIDGLSTVVAANAVYGRATQANAWGVYGLSDVSVGVAGIGFQPGSTGVLGQGWRGTAGQFVIDNTFAGNISNVLEVSNTQTGRAGNFAINNAASTADVIYATTDATSALVTSVHGVNGNSGIALGAKKGVWGESNSGVGVYGTSSTSNGIMGTTSTGNAGIVGFTFSGFSGVYAQNGSAGTGLYATSASGSAGRFQNSTVGSTSHVVEVLSNSTSTFGSGIYVNMPLGTSFDAGVRSIVTGSGANAILGEANNGPNAWAIVGMSATGRAGQFFGNVDVVGTLSKSAGTFKIDHPMDPANKYLIHSFVESPDMMNVYNGNIKTDALGKAVVDLPAYFEAENIDFKYQLTIVDETQFAMARVSRKIANNKFEIMTDKPGIEVSWQVTGVRNDAYAQKNRVIPEVQKTGSEAGKYISPELFGMPKEMGVYYKGEDKGQYNRPVAPPVLPENKLAAVGTNTHEQAIPSTNTIGEKSKALAAGLKPVEEVKYITPQQSQKSGGIPAVNPVQPNQIDIPVVTQKVNAATNGQPLMKPVMTGQLQRGTAPAAPVAEDANNKERGKLNKVQGEKPATEPAKPAEVPVKFEKGKPEAEK